MKVTEEKKDEVLDDFSAKNQNNRFPKLAMKEAKPFDSYNAYKSFFHQFPEEISGHKKSS